jgi:hypothetical protein
LGQTLFHDEKDVKVKKELLKKKEETIAKEKKSADDKKVISLFLSIL